MKKIAFITPSYFPSTLTGSGIVVMKLAEEFAKYGYDLSVITSNALTTRYWYDPIFGKKIKKKFETYHGVKIYRLPCFQIYSSICFILVRVLGHIIPANILHKLAIEAAGPYLIGLEALVKKENFDIIHCSPSPLAINMQTVRLLNRKKHKPKFIITPFFHSEVQDFSNPKLKQIFDGADAIHTITHAEKQILQKRFAISAKKMHVVPLFLETHGMHSKNQLQKDVDIFKKKYKLEKKKIILFAGIKGYAKGATSLLLAINKLYHQDPNYILIAIGTSTKEWIQTKSTVDTQCLLDLPYKTGKEKEIIFSSCTVFCMPSKSESFGMVYLEAWHKQKPVISASTPAVREFLAKNSLFVTFDNIRQIEKAIHHLCEDKITQKKLGENGYNTLMEKYMFRKVFPKYRDLFNN